MSTHPPTVSESRQLQAGDGLTDAVFIHPEGHGPWPGVLVLTDIGGLRPSQEVMASRLAAEGYVALIPNLFYRTSKPPVFDFPMRFGDERVMKRVGELTAPLTPEAQERDVRAYVRDLAAYPSVAAGPMGAVGYCFGGAVALRAAAAAPDRIRAVASFHGGRLITDAPSSPHRLLPHIQARLYFGHADNDQSMSKEAIDHLQQALDAWGGHAESELYEGARHGWTVSDSPAYDHAAAERAHAKLVVLFAETLK